MFNEIFSGRESRHVIQDSMLDEANNELREESDMNSTAFGIFASGQILFVTFEGKD